jgi:hypothetical protein
MWRFQVLPLLRTGGLRVVLEGADDHVDRVADEVHGACVVRRLLCRPPVAVQVRCGTNHGRTRCLLLFLLLPFPAPLLPQRPKVPARARPGCRVDVVSAFVDAVDAGSCCVQHLYR